ncbi:hypothetical protein HYDPIDRAFT_65038, partial [Hydnomerulius pinastri MD-312]
LASEDSASWIKSDRIRNSLISELGIQAVVRGRLYPILVPYLPIAANPEDPWFLREIEEENGLEAGVLDSGRWVKPKERRAQSQRVAHAMLYFCDAMAANILIRNGIYFRQEKFFPRKDKREALCCVRCQLWGHIAKDCKADHDTCGTCGDKHRTSECCNPNKLYCVSCKSKDHASYHRGCKEFLKRCAALDAKLPENLMPYYPTDAEWT